MGQVSQVQHVQPADEDLAEDVFAQDDLLPSTDPFSTNFKGIGPLGAGSDTGDPCCAVPCGFDCHRLWVRGDYLLWWTKGFSTPPLVTTSTTGTAREDAGILGLPSTSIVLGSERLDDAARSGGRVRLGYWFDPCETAGVEAVYFGLGTDTTRFNASGAQFPILARPFVNIETDFVGNDAELVAFPGLFSGNVAVVATTQLQGIEVLFRHAICHACCFRVDALAGWRFNRLDDSLVINDSKTVLSGDTGLPVGTTLAEFDSFTTRNTFNGAEIGFTAEARRCRWWLETRMTLALGNNQSRVNINGQTSVSTPVNDGPPQVVTTPAGLLAQSTNIGTYTTNDFAVVPQVGVTLGCQLTCRVWATVGYNFMYWSNVSRPGEQIDTDVNLSQVAPGGLVGLPRPTFTGATSNFWAQGLNLGLACRF